MSCSNKETLFALLMMLQLGANVAVLAILPIHLSNTSDKACLLSNDVMNQRPCNFGYIVSGIGGSACIHIALMIICHGSFFTSVKAFFLCLMSAWYACGGGILTLYTLAANEESVPQEVWRTVVIALLWSNLGLTLLAAILNSLTKKNEQVNLHHTQLTDNVTTTQV
jgi:hypothetical protein